MALVVMDAGHGGNNPGAVYQGRQEKDDALALTLAVGALGEVLDYRLCVVLASLSGVVLCHLIMWRGREDVKKVYNKRY